MFRLFAASGKQRLGTLSQDGHEYSCWLTYPSWIYLVLLWTVTYWQGSPNCGEPHSPAMLSGDLRMRRLPKPSSSGLQSTHHGQVGCIICPVLPIDFIGWLLLLVLWEVNNTYLFSLGPLAGESSTTLWAWVYTWRSSPLFLTFAPYVVWGKPWHTSKLKCRLQPLFRLLQNFSLRFSLHFSPHLLSYAYTKLWDLLVTLLLAMAKMAIYKTREQRLAEVGACDCGAYFHSCSRIQAEFHWLVSAGSLDAFEGQ